MTSQGRPRPRPTAATLQVLSRAIAKADRPRWRRCPTCPRGDLPPGPPINTVGHALARAAAENA